MMAGTVGRGRAPLQVDRLRLLGFALVCLAMLLAAAARPALAQQSGTSGDELGLVTQDDGAVDAGPASSEWTTGAIILGGAFALGALASGSLEAGIVTAIAAAGLYALMP
jgi:hypothetical protein